MRQLIHRLLVLVTLSLPLGLSAQTDSVTVQQPAEDFVIASVCVASPGEEIYSALGHACLRLQCPDHKLDYIFSYEAEDVSHNVLQFFAGRLKMGVRAVPTSEYVAQYAAEGRGVMEYPLHLPIRVKQRLWQRMDERLEYSPMAYDYMDHGCAVSVLSWLEDAIGPDSLQYAPWPQKYCKSRNELATDSIHQPWTQFFLETFIAGKGFDLDVPMQSKVMTPADLVEVVSGAKAFGQNLMVEGEHNVLLRKTVEVKYTKFTPVVFMLLLLVVCLLNMKLHLPVIDKAVLGVVSLIGFFLAYLVFVSNLTCTEWSWLIIPFNPLPLLLLRWRRHWALAYAALCVLWAVALLLYPHKLANDAHLVLAICAALCNVEFFIRNRKNECNINLGIMKCFNSLRLKSLLMVLFTMFSLTALGNNNKDYYSKATAKSTGNGNVYVSYKEASEPEYSSESSAESGADNQADVPNHTYYLYAQANDGYKFAGWYDNEECIGDFLSTDEVYKVEITAATSVGNATKNYYAKFEEAGVPVFRKDVDHGYVKLSEGAASGYGLTVENVSATFASSNEAVITVGADGKVTPVAPGSAIISAESEGYEPISCIVTVVDDINAGVTQIGNGDFEDWRGVTSSNHAPDNWNSFETNEGAWASAARAQQIAMVEGGRPGSNGLYCVDIYSRSVFGTVAQGNLTLGYINAGATSAVNANNHNRSKITDPKKSETIDKIPSAIKVWVKFTPAAENAAHPNARVAATIHDAYNFITQGAPQFETEENASHAIAQAAVNFPACEWQELTIPFELTGNATAVGQKYIIVNISTNADPGQGQAGDHLLIDDIQLVYNETDYDTTPLVMSDAKYATFVSPFDVNVPYGMKAYTVRGIQDDGTTLDLVEVEETIEANVPVILSGEKAANLVAYGVAAPATAEEGLLTGVYEDTPAPVGSYVLQNKGGVVGMYKVVEGSQPTVKAGRCYLTAPAAAAKALVFTSDDATAIKAINAQANTQDAVYNLAGQRVNKAEKGIFIVNGKKVLK